jgi:hypothetical protein
MRLCASPSIPQHLDYIETRRVKPIGQRASSSRKNSIAVHLASIPITLLIVTSCAMITRKRVMARENQELARTPCGSKQAAGSYLQSPAMWLRWFVRAESPTSESTIEAASEARSDSEHRLRFDASGLS